MAFLPWRGIQSHQLQETVHVSISCNWIYLVKPLPASDIKYPESCMLAYPSLLVEICYKSMHLIYSSD